MSGWWQLSLSGWGRRGRARHRVPVVRHIVLAHPWANLRDCCDHVAGCGCQNVRPLSLIHGCLCLCPHPDTRDDLFHSSTVHSVEEDVWIPLGAAPTLHGIGSRRSQAQGIPWGVTRIGAPKAWSVTRGKGVRVAVVDTGVDLEHPGLAPTLRGGINILNPEMPPMDDNGHGTHVAGIVAAMDDAQGVIGVAPACDLYSVKAFDHTGGAGVSDVLLALQWCVDYDMQVINTSCAQGQRWVPVVPRGALVVAVRSSIGVGTRPDARPGGKHRVGHPPRCPSRGNHRVIPCFSTPCAGPAGPLASVRSILKARSGVTPAQFRMNSPYSRPKGTCLGAWVQKLGANSPGFRPRIRSKRPSGASFRSAHPCLYGLGNDRREAPC